MTTRFSVSNRCQIQPKMPEVNPRAVRTVVRGSVLGDPGSRCLTWQKLILLPPLCPMGECWHLN